MKKLHQLYTTYRCVSYTNPDPLYCEEYCHLWYDIMQSARQVPAFLRTEQVPSQCIPALAHPKTSDLHSASDL